MKPDKKNFFTFGFSRSIPRNSSSTSSSLARSKSSKSFDKIVIFRYNVLLVTFYSPLYNRPRWKSEEAERFADRPSSYHDPAYTFGDSGWKDKIRIFFSKNQILTWLPGFIMSITSNSFFLMVKTIMIFCCSFSSWIILDYKEPEKNNLFFRL